ncbi:cytochrome c [Chloroflexi bacterium TSY]|nr:cytochrome c [Chloroflexi bacterium TSY]
MVRTIIFVVSGFIVLAILLPIQSQAQQGPQSPDYDPAQVALPVQTPVARLGRSIFLESCAPCHGLTGQGDGEVVENLPAPPPSFIDPENLWQRSPAHYFHTTKFGRLQNLMPPWQNQLTDEQIWQAVYYTWSLHTDQESVEQGRALFEAGESMLDSNRREELNQLLDPATQQFRTQEELTQDVSTLFEETDVNWSETDLANVVEYMRSQHYIAPWESGFRAGNGTIQGQVVLVTENGETEVSNTEAENNLLRTPLNKQRVNLSAFSAHELLATFETTTDENGQFAFADLAADTGIGYVMETMYKDILYRSDIVELAPLQPSSSLDLPVYETTDDPSGIFLNRVNWVVDFEPGALIIGQILSFGNNQVETFIGRNVEKIDFPVTAELVLPEQSHELQFQDGELGNRYQQVNREDKIVVYDTEPVRPGELTNQIFLGHRYPVEGDSVKIEQEFLYSLEQVNLLVADLPELRVDVTGLELIGQESIQGTEFRLWSSVNPATQSFTLELTGAIPPGGIDPRLLTSGQSARNPTEANVPPPAATPPLAPVIPFALGGGVILVLVGVFAFSLQRQRSQDQVTHLQQQRDSLILEIAELDELHAAAKMDDQTWTDQRAGLKGRLLEIAGLLNDKMTR